MTAVTGLRISRGLLGAAGIAAGLYGGWLLWANPLEVIIRIAVWAGVGVIVHDFVFAPLCAVIGVAGRRVIRGRWWTPVSVAGLFTVVLLLLAVPVYTRPGANPTNPTVVDRNYPLGLTIALAIVWACVPVAYLVGRLLPVREDQVVEQESAEHVDGQPPAL
ncbi:MAG: hypothetical protein ABW137_30950 [Mycobacterium sp.]